MHSFENFLRNCSFVFSAGDLFPQVSREVVSGSGPLPVCRRQCNETLPLVTVAPSDGNIRRKHPKRRFLPSCPDQRRRCEMTPCRVFCRREDILTRPKNNNTLIILTCQASCKKEPLTSNPSQFHPAFCSKYDCHIIKLFGQLLQLS